MALHEERGGLDVGVRTLAVSESSHRPRERGLDRRASDQSPRRTSFIPFTAFTSGFGAAIRRSARLIALAGGGRPVRATRGPTRESLSPVGRAGGPEYSAFGGGGGAKKKRRGVCASTGAARIGGRQRRAGRDGALRGRSRPGPACVPAALAALVQEEEIARIIVGFPLDLAGDGGEAAATPGYPRAGDRRRHRLRCRARRRAAHHRPGAARPDRHSGLNPRIPAHIDEASATAIQTWLDARTARRESRERA